MGGRVCAARDHFPALGAIQHGAKQAEHAIGVVGRVLKVRMELGDISGPQLQELSIAKLGRMKRFISHSWAAIVLSLQRLAQ